MSRKKCHCKTLRYVICVISILQCACNTVEDHRNSIQVKAPLVDIGRTPKTNHFEVQFNLTLSSSSREVYILGFKQSCNCFDIAPNSQKIQPGRSAMFKAVINFEKTHIDEISKQFHLYAWPVVNKDGARIILDEAKIEFCGTVYDPLHIEESEIRLGKLLEGRQYSEEVKIGVESKWEIGIEQEPQYWKIEIHPIKNEAAYQMVLTEKKMIPSGKFKDTLVLWGKNIENIIIYRNMQISGIIEDRVKIEPERIDFGVVSVGEEIVVSLELKNSDESNRFGIRDYEIPHAFEATEATISKDAHTIEISLLPVEAGLVNDVIKIYVKSKYNDEKICIVSVAGIIIKKSQGKEVIQFKHAGDDKVLLKQ